VIMMMLGRAPGEMANAASFPNEQRSPRTGTLLVITR
jgi:hypothetical protein